MSTDRDNGDEINRLADELEETRGKLALAELDRDEERRIADDLEADLAVLRAEVDSLRQQLQAARSEVGEGWFAAKEGEPAPTLAEAISRKTRMLETVINSGVRMTLRRGEP